MGKTIQINELITFIPLHNISIHIDAQPLIYMDPKFIYLPYTQLVYKHFKKNLKKI